LTPIGAAFTGGELPYALAWHQNRLWVGTTNGLGTVGAVYGFRPGIDTAWTVDHRLASDHLGGVHALQSYRGKLYVGTDAAAGTQGAVLVRDALGVYTVADVGGDTPALADMATLIADAIVSPMVFVKADTARALRDPWDLWYLPSFDSYTIPNAIVSPTLFAAYNATDVLTAELQTGTTIVLSAIVNNGYLALAVLDDLLYVSYWNHGTTATSLIRTFDGTTWRTSYTGVDDTLRPFIAFFPDSGLLFAIGGGMHLTGALVSTDDGVTWIDKTPYLPETDKTLLPIFGVEVL
jgi:hypothetical protein